MMSSDGSGLEEPDVEVSASMAGGGNAVFSRDKTKQANLSDFVIKKMIGKGTFGKVFLVEQKGTGHLFAMKCIRKDVILENE